MGERRRDSTGEQRDQTDESLRAERESVDALATKTRVVLETRADAVVQLARDRADLLVQTARDDADQDRVRGPHSTVATEALLEEERSRADLLLEHERSSADSIVARERAAGKRYLATFLAAEREATDEDLTGERAHADTVVATRDEFLATVSHDLRSLLGGLSLNAALLVADATDGPGGDRMRKHAATSARLVARMDRLINDLLDVASIEAGKLALIHEEVELADILRDTIEAFEPIAAARRVVLQVDAEDTPLRARVDSGRILQVLANLLSNAIKFTPAEGRVSLRLCSEGTDLHIAVSDTGIGVPAEELEAIFERFRQLGKDRRGLGLGLHICKSIVEAHGGRMWAESELGAGSTFHVTLPASIQHVVPASRSEQTVVAPTPSSCADRELV